MVQSKAVEVGYIYMYTYTCMWSMAEISMTMVKLLKIAGQRLGL